MWVTEKPIKNSGAAVILLVASALLPTPSHPDLPLPLLHYDYN